MLLPDEGIILVDSPGLSDANSTRVENAARYHKEYTHKITVAEIRQAKNDELLRDNLALGYTSRGSGNIILALPGGDKVDSDTDVSGSILKKRWHRRSKHKWTAVTEPKVQLPNFIAVVFPELYLGMIRTFNLAEHFPRHPLKCSQVCLPLP